MKYLLISVELCSYVSRSVVAVAGEYLIGKHKLKQTIQSGEKMNHLRNIMFTSIWK